MRDDEPTSIRATKVVESTVVEEHNFTIQKCALTEKLNKKRLVVKEPSGKLDTKLLHQTMPEAGKYPNKYTPKHNIQYYMLI